MGVDAPLFLSLVHSFLSTVEIVSTAFILAQKIYHSFLLGLHHSVIILLGVDASFFLSFSLSLKHEEGHGIASAACTNLALTDRQKESGHRGYKI